MGPRELSTSSVPILQVGKPKAEPKMVTCPESHSEWQSQSFNPGHLTPNKDHTLHVENRDTLNLLKAPTAAMLCRDKGKERPLKP